jgi:hypothetical protein
MQVAPSTVLSQLISGIAGSRPDQAHARPDGTAAQRTPVRAAAETRAVIEGSPIAVPNRNLPRGSLIDIKA